MSDGIKTHKDLTVWQEAMKLAKEMGMASNTPEILIEPIRKHPHALSFWISFRED